MSSYARPDGRVRPYVFYEQPLVLPHDMQR
jgi:hypothetical protein